MNLTDLGLSRGDPVRYRRREDQRWREATFSRLEDDGSIGVRDANGASLAIRIEWIEVRSPGPRGRLIWKPLPDRLSESQQLGLF